MDTVNDHSYRAEADEMPTTAVVSAVETHSGIRMEDLPPLYETIDTDALDAMFSPWDDVASDSRFSFTYSDVRVTVSGSRRVDIESSE